MGTQPLQEDLETPISFTSILYTVIGCFRHSIMTSLKGACKSQSRRYSPVVLRLRCYLVVRIGPRDKLARGLCRNASLMVSGQDCMQIRRRHKNA